MKFQLRIEKSSQREWRLAKRMTTNKGFSSWGCAVIKDGYTDVEDAKRDFKRLKRREVRQMKHPRP